MVSKGAQEGEVSHVTMLFVLRGSAPPEIFCIDLEFQRITKLLQHQTDRFHSVRFVI